MPIRRNPVVRAGAILRKGGVHLTSKSGRRQRCKRALCNELSDWYIERGDSEQQADSGGPADLQHEAVDRQKFFPVKSRPGTDGYAKASSDKSYIFIQ